MVWGSIDFHSMDKTYYASQREPKLNILFCVQ